MHILKNADESVRIAVVGKYMELKESYKSLMEALVHGGIANGVHVELDCIDAEKMEKQDVQKLLEGVQGILIPGGFGDRGTEGKVRAVRYAREHKVPFFGICLGMQIAVAEFARNVCSLKGANSVEFDPKTKYPVIDLMDEQKDVDKMGGTMRLGAYPCVLASDSLSARLYRKTRISERHRHRYEFNNRYREVMQEKGLRLSGLSPDGNLVEVIELRDHPWFVGCQFHPEFKSRPTECHPLFRGFIRAALQQRSSVKEEPRMRIVADSARP